MRVSAVNDRTPLLLVLTVAILFAGCIGPLKDLGVEDWTCDVADPAAGFLNKDAEIMKQYTGGDCAALVAECRHQDICRLVKTEDEPEYLLVGLDLSDPEIQQLIIDGTGG